MEKNMKSSHSHGNLFHKYLLVVVYNSQSERNANNVGEQGHPRNFLLPDKKGETENVKFIAIG